MYITVKQVNYLREFHYVWSVSKGLRPSIILRIMAWQIMIITCLPAYVWAHENHTQPEKVVHAVKSQSHVSIDGILDEETWVYASPIRDFLQRDPDQGAAPTESTWVQIIYDDEAIYFGITAFDSEPEKIVKRLARRDRPWDGDYVSVSIDPYHDHRSGFYFAVNAAGIEGDGLNYNDTRRDSDWDAVWDRLEEQVRVVVKADVEHIQETLAAIAERPCPRLAQMSRIPLGASALRARSSGARSSSRAS